MVSLACLVALTALALVPADDFCPLGHCAATADSLLQKVHLREKVSLLPADDLTGTAEAEEAEHNQDPTRLGEGVDAEDDERSLQDAGWCTPGVDVDAFGMVEAAGEVGTPFSLAHLQAAPRVRQRGGEEWPWPTQAQFQGEGSVDVESDGSLGDASRVAAERPAGDVSLATAQGSLRDVSLSEVRVATQPQMSFNEVSPNHGSIMGGTTLTIKGSNLYEAHNTMSSPTAGTVSSLQPPLRVFLGTIECDMLAFESRHDSIKCVTKALPSENQNLVDVALPVSVMALQPDGSYAAAAKQGEPTFRFATAVTPELSSVSPQVAGPGEVLQLTAWTCSGIVEADPVEIVRLPESPDADADGAETELVADAANAWGAICEPFPPLGKRDELQRATQLDAEQASGEASGAPGLYAIVHEASGGNLLTRAGMLAFLETHDIPSAQHFFIAERPALVRGTQHWEGLEPPFLVDMSGRLEVKQAGQYQFKLECIDACIGKIDDTVLRGSGRDVGGWGSRYALTSDPIDLAVGWHRLQLVHVASRAGGESAMYTQYTGPDTVGWQALPVQQLRAGVSRATVDALNAEAQRQMVGRGEHMVAPAKVLFQGPSPTNSAMCPDGHHRKLVQFRCKVPADMEPGHSNVKFHDYHFGQSVEGRSSQWDVGMGEHKASLLIVPKVTRVTQTAGGNLLLRGVGLDRLLAANDSTAQYQGHLYKPIDSSQDHLELRRVGPAAPRSKPSGSTGTLGTRGLQREFWLHNQWPDDLDAMGVPASRERASQLQTLIEDGGGAALGFAERLTGVMVPPYSAECRFRVQGTGGSTENNARLYFSRTPLSRKGGRVARAQPLFGWPGGTFAGAPKDAVDLAQEGFEGHFAGAWGVAFAAVWDAPLNEGTLLAFGESNQNRVQILGRSSGRVEFSICAGRHCSTIYGDNVLDAGTEHRWLFGVSEFNRMVIIRDGQKVREGNGRTVASQSEPYYHLWIGRGFASDSDPFVGTVSHLRVFNSLPGWDDAFQTLMPPTPTPVPVPPFFTFHGVGKPANSSSNSSAGGSPVRLASFAENNFDDRGDTNLNMASSFNYVLAGGFPCVLSGWTHTRRFAKGFLRNRPGSGLAVVSGLEPNKTYDYRIYQYASHYEGTNGLSVNGDPVVSTYQSTSLAPTACSSAVASAAGEITFEFIRQYHHVHLSAIAVAKAEGESISPGALVEPVDLADEGLGALGGAMSVAFTARWDPPLDAGARVFDFGNGNNDNVAVEHLCGSLNFLVRRAGRAYYVSAPEAVVPGEEHHYLVVVTEAGRMLVFRDGVLLGERIGGQAPALVSRFHLYVGKSNDGDVLHRGQIKHLKIFKAAARWADAFGERALPAPRLPPLPRVDPLVVYAGRNFSGGEGDVEDISGAFHSGLWGAVSVAFTVKWNALANDAKALDFNGQLVVSGDSDGALRFLVASEDGRSSKQVVTPASTITIGTESNYLCAVTSRGQMAVYKDGALLADLDAGMVPDYIRLSRMNVGGPNFQATIKGLRVFNSFVRWQQAFRVFTSNNATQNTGPSLLQASHSATAPLGGTMEITYPTDPIVTTRGAEEQVSDWLNLDEGEEYPFQLERRLGGKTQETGPTGWAKLGLECRNVYGNPGLLTRRRELVTMRLKDYPVRLSLPTAPGALQLGFRSTTVQAADDAQVGPSVLQLFGGQCTISPPWTDDGEIVGQSWEVEAASSPRSDAYCGLGALTPLAGPSGEWKDLRVKLFSGQYRLQEYQHLTMCMKMAPGTVVNMLVKARVGTRRREQWFSVGMTATGYSSFHSEYRRAAQWPLDENATDGEWRCPSFNLFFQIMSPDDYERTFRDVDYRRNPAILSEMEILEIHLGSPVYSGGRFQSLHGEITVDQLLLSKSAVTVHQSGPSPLQSLFPLRRIEGADTRLGWTVEWFAGSSFYKNRGAHVPVQVTKTVRLDYHLGTGGDNPTGLADRFGFIATAKNLFEEGEYRFLYIHDDSIAVYVDGALVADTRCCTSRTRSSNRFSVTAGLHTIEVHYYEGTGNAYMNLRWRKEGTSVEISEVSQGDLTGVSEPHALDFFPAKRDDLAALEALLKEVQVRPVGGSAQPPNVSLPEGTPNTIVTAWARPRSGEWERAVVLRGSGLEVALDIGEAAFNEHFERCPAVRYKRNGDLHSVYVRTSPVPAGFNAYKVFTETWAQAGNQLGVDMEIYGSEADARAGSGKWTYCNYDYQGVGYPRDCGPTRSTRDQWFSLPRNGGGPYLSMGASFEVYVGDSCPSTAANSTGTAQATFDMNDTGAEIESKLSAAGLPDVQVRILGAGGMRWLDLTSQPVRASSEYDTRTVRKAVDGVATTDHSGCFSSLVEVGPWMSVQLGGKHLVNRLRVLSRSGNGGDYLRGLVATVDGLECTTEPVSFGHGEWTEISCVGYGETLTLRRPGNNQLAICELEVSVREADLGADQLELFVLEVTNVQPGDEVPRIVFQADLSGETVHDVSSTGTRFFSTVTDYWFRQPHAVEQPSFGSWREYICGTELARGCSPELDRTGPPSLLQSGSQALTRATGRRQPQRRWRVPSRYLTPEALEGLRRAVLGSSGRAHTWAETSSLLQMGRRGRDQRRGHAKDDPRNDPDLLLWSSPDSWGGEEPPRFETTDIVYIPEGESVRLDTDVYIRFWVIEGNVVWDQTKDLHMEAEAIIVNGGQLLIGSEEEPYTMQGKITLHGHWHSYKLPLFGTKGIFETMGNIEMHGAPTALTWTALAKTAHPGDVNITLLEAVDWKPGDMLVIAGSDRAAVDCRIDRRDACEVEERYVQQNHGTVITLSHPLDYRHVAEEYDPKLPAEYCAESPDLCGKTQVRAEVGLLTHNIKVQGDNFMDGSGPPGSEGYGAHIMMAERGKFSYVEFHWMGQAFQMGRYPVHFHLTGLNPHSYIMGCSVHVTFNRGVTVHGTHQMVVKDNVLYNQMSHGFFIEDGNEHDNIIEHNLGMLTHKSFSILISDQTPATFWIRNPSNYFRHNHAAGSASFGFWFDTLAIAAPTLQREFWNNTAHSNGDTGVWVDIVDSRESCLGPDGWTVAVPFRDSDTISRPVHTNGPSCDGRPRVNFPFLSTTTWGNIVQGMTLFETGHLHIINHRSVSDGIGLTVWGVQSDNFPDETNGWYGPVVRNSVYHSQSALTEAGWGMSCGIQTPWDDTLFITSVQFVGPVTTGHICPCADCFVFGEGGYQIRTSKLGWHEGAGTPTSQKAFFAWQFVSFFFDADGTLTEDTPQCQQSGCYLHSPLNIGGMLQHRLPGNDTAAPDSGIPDSLLQSVRTGTGCMSPLVGNHTNRIIPDEAITASTIHGNRETYGHGAMWRTRIPDGEPGWCAQHNNREQYLEWDFGTPKFVQAVQTMGSTIHDNWVTRYRLSYSPDGQRWVHIDTEYEGNRDRSSLKENRVSPFVARKVRLHPTSWHRHVCMRAEVLGCDASDSSSYSRICQDKAYLDDDLRNCRDIERSYGNDATVMMREFCALRGQNAKHSMLTANQACCACGGGRVSFNWGNESDAAPPPPDQAPVKSIDGGTAYLDPNLCRVVDSSGGIVCSRSVRMQTVTVKDAGIWHELNPIHVHSDFGWAQIMYAPCYKQYEFSVLQGMRQMLIPPFSPQRMWDWDKMTTHVTMRKGDEFVLQVETLHNPDGYTVQMPGVTKTALCSDAPVKYGEGFVDNSTLLGELRREQDQHSAAALGLDLGLDLYKVAHVPLLDTAWQDRSAANWGYLPANASYTMHEWYPGMLSMLLTDKGVLFGSNHLGAWDGLRANPLEQMVTRPLASKGGADFGFSHVHTEFKWARWDRTSDTAPPPGIPVSTTSRLEYLVQVCGMSAAALGHLGADVEAAVANASVHSGLPTGQVLRFHWSAWPSEAGPKPVFDTSGNNMGFGNVTIEPHWEVTLDEDVDFINKLNISGVLKFADTPGCCKLAARYIMVGAFYGRLEAGTEASPITQGRAHIVLKGHPMTPHLEAFAPHIEGSAKWLMAKYLAVQGTLSLYGAPRSKIWARLAHSANKGDTSLVVEGGDFLPGDAVTIERGLETRKLLSVTAGGSGVVTLTFAEPLALSYRGAEYSHLGRFETQGLMAAHVGLVDGHTVVVEGEDTPGAPMCDLNETHRCPYQDGLPAGVSLHDFAKEMRAFLEETGSPNHPNCRPCRACSEMGFAGYVIAMAHFHRHYTNCPKDHGVIEASNVAFNHGSSMHLYHDYSAGNYPYDVPKDFPKAWSRRPYTWWSDPLWKELNLDDLATPSHLVERSSFNSSFCGTGLALSTSGVLTLPTRPVTGNVFLDGGVGLNAAARSTAASSMLDWKTDKQAPQNDNAVTRTQGVGSPNDAGNPAAFEKFSNAVNPAWHFDGNFLSGAPLTSMSQAHARGNVINAPVRLQGSETANVFRDNTISAPGSEACVKMWSAGTQGIHDNVVFGCDVCIAFRSEAISEGVVKGMKLLDCSIGLNYWTGGTDGKKHDSRELKFLMEDTTIYSRAGGRGIGMTNPKVHFDQLGEPAAPDWWIAGPKSHPIGHSRISVAFSSEVRRTTFVGYKRSAGGVAFAFGEGAPGDTSDADYHPVTVAGLVFDDVAEDSYMRFATPRSAGPDLRQCLQIDCDGRRNSLLIDMDGSLLGQPGTVVPLPHKFYERMSYVDPLGLDTMEDLIPMTARYDRFGAAIPFPSGVDHGHGGDLEYECKSSSGCDVLFQQEGHWLPRVSVPGFSPGAKIIAVREEGGLIRLDALHYGWQYANGWVSAQECRLTSPSDVTKPESQHARRYGRVAPGHFGTHPNTTREHANAGPVYTTPGIWSHSCTEDAQWGAYKCPGGYHRHLVLEVMDWNHMDRRWAPVSVEVNDKWAPQGGALNVLTGPAMMWPGKRLQTFHALGHVGMRHNVYFTGDPPQHLRVHLQNAPPETGVVVCIYYGIPNTVYAYVNGKRKEPLDGATPSWDNLALVRLTQDMEHGTHYYDRVGVETGRPGYLYAVVRGGQSVDFKISHKVMLTTKVTVDASWGGWKNSSGNNFFKQGIDGLVRNIALLIGAPPSRVKILGEGTAVKGTFWNEQTTSKDFAEWMWKQNESMAYSPTDHWLSAPSYHGVVNATPANSTPTQLLRLSLAGLSREEASMALERHALKMLEQASLGEVDTILRAQEDSQTRAGLGESCIGTDGCGVPVTLTVDDEPGTPATAAVSEPGEMSDAVAREDDRWNREEREVEGETDNMLSNCQQSSNTVGCELSTPDAAEADVPLLKVTVDDVPRMDAPAGWRCDPHWFGDGAVCHCECGIWDPDCDAHAHGVPAIAGGSGSIDLLDKLHVRVLMNLIDADGNANGVLDGKEILDLDGRLGQSALYGVAKRIIAAQEKGANQRSESSSAIRLGDYAFLRATRSAACAYQLKEGPPLDESLASFQPVCVRDSEFNKLVGEATGRCALLPEMKIGSQCMVPGESFSVTLRRNQRGNESNSSRVFTPSEEAVCGTLGNIFRRGQGMGGYRSASGGTSSAKWTNPGSWLLPGTGSSIIDMKELGLQKLDATFQHGFAFYAIISFNRIDASGTAVLSFGNRGYRQALDGPHIMVYAQKSSSAVGSPGRLIFYCNVNNRDSWRYLLQEDDCVNMGEPAAYLFTLSPTGEVAIFKNGVELGRKQPTSRQILVTPGDGKDSFDDMWIGGGSDCKSLWRHCRDHYGFEGTIHDIRVWDHVVSWNEAVAGTPEGTDGQAPPDDSSGDLPASCVSSQQNSWDFVCDTEVPPELRDQFGIGGPASDAARQQFDRREDRGEVTVCGSSNSIKGTIFHGKFGDGLTGEYFQVRTNDCRPPFLLGVTPTLVKVDETIDFDPITFASPFNEYAIRWTGKLLVDVPGNYEFKLESKDGSWLAVGNLLVASNPGCHSLRSSVGQTTLEKGGHQIAVFFFNRGPRDEIGGKVKLSYRRPPQAWEIVPQEKLGSAPMRLSKLSRHASEDEDDNETTTELGSFVYDEKRRLGVMPTGSCDVDCRRGQRKSGAAPFRFFCPQPTTVAFVATVNSEARMAMVWLDDQPLQTWFLGQSSALMEVPRPSEVDLLKEQAAHNETAAVLLATMTEQDFIMVPSARSPGFPVAAGEHMLSIQGRMENTEAFALGGIRFDPIGTACVFFLEGKDKLPDDC